MVEMLMAVYEAADIEKIRRHDPGRDRIIVSKGHAAAATYCVMHHYGLLDRTELATYYQDGSVYAGHVSHAVEHVEHSTGALGHGLSVACGCALGLKRRGFENARVFALLGDGEIQEGSVWEAVMFAHHHCLDNLVVLIDNNRISSITQTDAVLNMQPLTNRFAGFGLHTLEVDGHDLPQLRSGIQAIREAKKPGVIICNTVKGRGVDFAENQAIWHYRSLNDKLYHDALAGLEGRAASSGRAFSKSCSLAWPVTPRPSFSPPTWASTWSNGLQRRIPIGTPMSASPSKT
jgi:transketolase